MFLKTLFRKGFRIGYSIGKPFDPREQKRTDAMEDIVKGLEKRKRGKDVDN